MRIYGEERYSQGRLLGEVVLLLRELELNIPKATDDERQQWTGALWTAVRTSPRRLTIPAFFIQDPLVATLGTSAWFRSICTKRELCT